MASLAITCTDVQDLITPSIVFLRSSAHPTHTEDSHRSRARPPSTRARAGYLASSTMGRVRRYKKLKACDPCAPKRGRGDADEKYDLPPALSDDEGASLCLCLCLG